MLVTIFILFTSIYTHVLNAHKVWRILKDNFVNRPPYPSNPSHPSHQTWPSASFCENVCTGPRRDIVVASSLKCTSQSAQLKPPTKTQILCPHPPKKWAYPPTKTQISCLPPPRKLKILNPTPNLSHQTRFARSAASPPYSLWCYMYK